MRHSFRYFVGVDQTGASISGGRSARPLPCAVFDATQYRLHLFGHDRKPLWLKSFNETSLRELFIRIDIEAAEVHSRTTAYLVDCVFGLSENTWPPHLPAGLHGQWRLFRRAAQAEGFGLKAAAHFFAQILKDAGVPPYPVRRCELLVNANSVFRTHPFQKNIQCGTYRIWKDFGSESKPWMNIRYLTPAADSKLDRPWLFEAYPSFIWREIFGLRTRDLKLFPEALNTVFPKLHLSEETMALLARDPNFTDAAVLALGGYALQRRGTLWSDKPSRSKWRSKEGWIIGVPEGDEQAP